MARSVSGATISPCVPWGGTSQDVLAQGESLDLEGSNEWGKGGVGREHDGPQPVVEPVRALVGYSNVFE